MTGTIEPAGDLAALDAALEALPNLPAVFVLWPRAEGEGTGQPYLSKTGLLRRRLLRLLKEREKPSRLLNLRHTVARIEYRLTCSSLETAIVHYQLARQYFPETYLEIVRLRMPTYVKIILNNEFPRSQLTTHLTRTAGPDRPPGAAQERLPGLGPDRPAAAALFFGPFRARASAERFESQFLDLFQMRRCQEDLKPSPDHPGCMYGEMSMCLRPCQEVVGAAEYGHEVARVVDFLRTEGHSLLDSIGRSRERLSEEMRFEDAARQHRRYEKVTEVLKLRDELARDLDRLHGVAITRSVAFDAVELWLVREGNLLAPRRFSFEVQEGKTISMDRRLRETISGAETPKLTVRERQEYLALLARWYYSTWRDGEWLDFDGPDNVPYRKLVNAISRVAKK